MLQPLNKVTRLRSNRVRMSGNIVLCIFTESNVRNNLRLLCINRGQNLHKSTLLLVDSGTINDSICSGQQLEKNTQRIHNNAQKLFRTCLYLLHFIITLSSRHIISQNFYLSDSLEYRFIRYFIRISMWRPVLFYDRSFRMLQKRWTIVTKNRIKLYATK